jgi:hypothetical protein
MGLLASIFVLYLYYHTLRYGIKDKHHHWMDDYGTRGEENKKRNEQ